MASSLLNSCEQGTVHAVVVLTSLSGLCIQMLSEYDLKYKHATTLIQKMGAVRLVLRSAGVAALLCPLAAAASNKYHCHCPVGPASPSVLHISWPLTSDCSVSRNTEESMAKSQKVKVLIDRPHQMRWHTNTWDAFFKGNPASIDDVLLFSMLLFFVALSCCILDVTHRVDTNTHSSLVTPALNVLCI